MAILLAMLLAAAARLLIERHLHSAAANVIALGVAALGLRASALALRRRAARRSRKQRQGLVRLKA